MELRWGGTDAWLHCRWSRKVSVCVQDRGGLTHDARGPELFLTTSLYLLVLLDERLFRLGRYHHLWLLIRHVEYPIL